MPVPQTGVAAGDELVGEVPLTGIMILTVTVLFELCVMVVVGPPTVAVLTTVVVTVPAGPFKPGVKPGTTPGVLVRRVGGGGGAAAAASEVQLHPSDIRATDAATVSGGTADDIDGNVRQLVFWLLATGEPADKMFPPGAGGGAKAVVMFETDEDEGCWRRLPPGPGGGAVIVLILSDPGTEEGCWRRLPPGPGGGTGAVVAVSDAAGEGCRRLPPGPGGGTTTVVMSFGAAAGAALELVDDNALTNTGPGPMFDKAVTALPAVRTRRAPGLPPEESDDEDPPEVKFAHASIVPLELSITTVRLPAKAAEPTSVDRYGST